MITDLRLQNFRSYKDASFEFESGVNIIVGPNASGKTNLLEAVLVMALGNSYRAKSQELILFNKPWTRLDSHNETGLERTVKITIEPQAAKSYEIAGKTYKRLSLGQTLPVVLFEPNHLRLLSGSPENRRDYLDDIAEQTIAGYGTVRRQYRRALAQRNSLLKRGLDHQVKAQVFPWDVRLSELGGQIARARQELIQAIDSQLPQLYRKISQSKTKVSVRYESDIAIEHYETRLLKKLENDLRLDMERGFTAAGPHREDFTAVFDERPASQVASRGETRTAVLALKIIELGMIEAARDTAPLLLLDDVFSELDGKRRHALTDYLMRYQTFITTTDADVVLQHFTDHCNVIALA